MAPARGVHITRRVRCLRCDVHAQRECSVTDDLASSSNIQLAEFLSTGLRQACWQELWKRGARCLSSSTSPDREGDTRCLALEEPAQRAGFRGSLIPLLSTTASSRLMATPASGIGRGPVRCPELFGSSNSWASRGLSMWGYARRSVVLRVSTEAHVSHYEESC